MKETRVKKTKLNIWIWRNLPHCKEIVKIITASLDGKISLRKKIIMKIHLFSCPPCENFLEQLKFLGSALRRSGENPANMKPDVKLSREARQRLKKALSSSINTLGLFFALL